MTASGGNLIGCEVHRNERSPQCGVEKIEEAGTKMKTNELNMNEMEMVSGGDFVGAVKGMFAGMGAGAAAGCAIGCFGGPVGAAIGTCIGGAAGIFSGAFYGDKKF